MVVGRYSLGQGLFPAFTARQYASNRSPCPVARRAANTSTLPCSSMQLNSCTRRAGPDDFPALILNPDAVTASSRPS